MPELKFGTKSTKIGVELETWIDILTDPHHLLADFLMNVGFEIVFAWITYLVLLRVFVKRGKGKHRK
jgi:hypothetical protein